MWSSPPPQMGPFFANQPYKTTGKNTLARSYVNFIALLFAAAVFFCRGPTEKNLTRPKNAKI